MGEFLIIVAFGLLGLWLYLVPAWVAFRRQHPNRWAILVVNLSFGGTGLGWAGALIWALHKVHLPADDQQSAGGQSGLNLFVNDARLVRLEGGAPIVGPGSRLPASAGPQGASATIEQLDRLDRLRGAGSLTDVEHQALRAAVLRAAGVV